MIPANEWWAVIEHYNQSVFPAQIVFYLLLAGALTFWLVKPSQTANRVVKIALVLTFGWIGIVFFLLMGQKLPAFGAQTFLFLTLAALFALDALTDNSDFCLPQPGWQRSITLVGFGLVAVYPLVGLLLGHPVSKLIVPGTFPCPTTAVALLLMSTTFPAKRRWLYLITLGFLALWAIPFPILIQIPKFGVYEDSIMLAAGLYALVMLAVNWRKQRS